MLCAQRVRLDVVRHAVRREAHQRHVRQDARAPVCPRPCVRARPPVHAPLCARARVCPRPCSGVFKCTGECKVCVGVWACAHVSISRQSPHAPMSSAHWYGGLPAGHAAWAQTIADGSPEKARPHTRTPTRPRTHARTPTRAHTHTHTHPPTHARTCAQTRTRTRTRPHTSAPTDPESHARTGAHTPLPRR